MKRTKKMKISHNSRVFPVIVREDSEGGFVVSNPAIPGCRSQGETIEEALANIKEATELCLEEMKENGKLISTPSISLHLINT